MSGVREVGKWRLDYTGILLLEVPKTSGGRERENRWQLRRYGLSSGEFQARMIGSCMKTNSPAYRSIMVKHGSFGYLRVAWITAPCRSTGERERRSEFSKLHIVLDLAFLFVGSSQSMGWSLQAVSRTRHSDFRFRVQVGIFTTQLREPWGSIGETRKGDR